MNNNNNKIAVMSDDCVLQQAMVEYFGAILLIGPAFQLVNVAFFQLQPQLIRHSHTIIINGCDDICIFYIFIYNDTLTCMTAHSASSLFGIDASSRYFSIFERGIALWNNKINCQKHTLTRRMLIIKSYVYIRVLHINIIIILYIRNGNLILSLLFFYSAQNTLIYNII